MSSRRCFLVAVLVSSAANLACADFDVKSWRHYSDLAPGTTADYVQVRIPPEVFDRARPDLADLRVVDEQNREAPYQLVVPAEQEREQAGTVRMFNYGRTKEGVTFTVDVGGRDFHNRLTIETPDTNFRQAVQIEGSDDLRRWVTIKQRGYLFDFSHEYHARSTTLGYPEARYRYLRVAIFHGGEKPLDVSGVSVSHLIPPARVEAEVHFASLNRAENAPDKTTDLTLDLGGRNVPVHRLEVRTPDTNFHRFVRVERSDNGRDWAEAGSGVIYHIRTERFQGEQGSVEFPETQSRTLRLRVHNYDDPPLRSLPVRLFGRPRAVVFHHEPPHRYRLFYGQAQAPPPRYDLAQIFPYLSAQKFNPLALTETKPNPAFVEPPPPRQPWTEEHPALLWAGLLGVVAVLGLLLWRAFTKVRAAMDDRSGEEE